MEKNLVRMFGTINISISIVLALTLNGCGVDQGACEWYPEERFEAEIAEINFSSINETGDSLFTVLLKVDRGSISDSPFDLGKFKKTPITREFLNRNKIKQGFYLTGKITDIKAGKCEAPIVAFDQKLR